VYGGEFSSTQRMIENDIGVSNGLSKYVTDFNEFGQPRIRESRNVNILISSTKIKIIPADDHLYSDGTRFDY
jgi:hypothetical protein